MKKKKVTIEELERILNDDEETPIEIMPDGSIRAKRKTTRKSKLKVLTMRENLGGEYSECIGC